MSLKEEFDRDFQPVLESVSLPERLAGSYTPESCMACREDGEIYLICATVDGVRDLDAPNGDIIDLSPLETLRSLQVLYLGNNPAHDLSPLSSLSRLRELNLGSRHGALNSLAPLAKLHLRQLCLCNQVPADGDLSLLGGHGRGDRFVAVEPARRGAGGRI